MATTATSIQAGGDAVVSPLAQATIAAGAVGAAVIHVAMFPGHHQESAVLGLGFALAGWFQLVLAGAILVRPSRPVLVAGLVGSLALIAAWAVSRTVGLPLSGHAGEIEDVGSVDLLAVALQAVTAAACGLSLRARPAAQVDRLPRMVAFAAPAVVVALATTVVLASPEAANHHAGDNTAHAHAEEADASAHTHVDDVAGGALDASHADHAGAGDHADHPAPVPYDPALPIDLSGTPGVTPEQQAQAENIIAVTLNGLSQWEDPAVAEAAGFRSIGDALTGYEHFVNQEFMDNPTIFDPDEPESLVYRIEGGQRVLSAAMYMLQTGTPLDEVPDIGGGLIQWHIHNNLCYSPDGKVRGLTDGSGNCPEGLVKPPETPMVHVWIEPHPCGPFAALEGVGAGQIAEGEERLCDTAHGSH